MDHPGCGGGVVHPHRHRIERHDVRHVARNRRADARRVLVAEIVDAFDRHDRRQPDRCPRVLMKRVVFSVVRLTMELRGGHLQQHGLQRHLDGGHRNTIRVLQIGNRLDVVRPGVEVDRLRGECRDAFHLVRRAFGSRPERDQAGRAARHDVDRIRNQRVVHRVRPVEDRPRDLDVLQPERGGVLLQELFVLHHVELQVAHGELARDANLLRGGSAGKHRRKCSGQQNGD